MIGDSINFINCNWNPVVLKKKAKISKNYHFLAKRVQEWGPHGPHPKQKTISFAEIIKPDHKLSKPFYFIKIYVLAELLMFFYFV